MNYLRDIKLILWRGPHTALILTDENLLSISKNVKLQLKV